MEERDPFRNRPLTLDDWRAICGRLVQRSKSDRLTLVAAGVAFYLVLALFPALAALASIYGLFTDPELLHRQLEALGRFAPDSVVDLLRRELQRFTGHSHGGFGLGLLVGVGFAVWAISRGVSTLITSMNIVYDQDETRGYLHKLGVTLGLSLAILAFVVVWFGMFALAPAALSALGGGGGGVGVVAVVRWPVFILTAAAGIGLIYRYGPNRAPRSLHAIVWGGAIALGVWVAGSLAFSTYVENFGAYDATYGSLAALAGLMVWIWMSTLVLLVGAELNAEIERHATGGGDSAGQS